MAAFTAERTARKPHKCSRCLKTIRAGERYLSAVLTPHHDDLGNCGWWRLAYHLNDDC